MYFVIPNTRKTVNRKKVRNYCIVYKVGTRHKYLAI